MPELTPGTSAVFIPEVWSKDVQLFVKQNLVMSDLVMRFDSDVKAYGDTIHVPKVTKIAAAAKADNTDITFTSPTESEVTININQYYANGFALTDIVGAQSKYDLRSIYTKSLGYGMAEQIDGSLTGLYSGLSQSVDSTGALTDANLLTAIQYLDDANAPMSERSFVFKPIVKKNIFALDKFVLFHNIGNDERITNGKVGDVYGVDCYVSTAIQTSTTTRNLMFHKEAFALAMQKEPEIKAQYMVRALRWEVACRSIYGVSEYRDTFGVEVKV